MEGSLTAIANDLRSLANDIDQNEPNDDLHFRFARVMEDFNQLQAEMDVEVDSTILDSLKEVGQEGGAEERNGRGKYCERSTDDIGSSVGKVRVLKYPHPPRLRRPCFPVLTSGVHWSVPGPQAIYLLTIHFGQSPPWLATWSKAPYFPHLCATCPSSNAQVKILRLPLLHLPLLHLTNSDLTARFCSFPWHHLYLPISFHYFSSVISWSSNSCSHLLSFPVKPQSEILEKSLVEIKTSLTILMIVINIFLVC
ncbi:hypothetical protein CRENBAI_019925 [Crenichthys baileyi]|uniref:Uncharacterized protein n=1 Tax=Crenichthys baileyi TaxID=28760 RepID=A0AAV9SSI3_9TELE